MQIQYEKNAFVERAGLIYTREILAVNFDRLASCPLVVGREILGESSVIAMSCMWTCAYLNGKVIASYIHLHKSYILGMPDPLLLGRGVAMPDL